MLSPTHAHPQPVLAHYNIPGIKPFLQSRRSGLRLRSRVRTLNKFCQFCREGALDSIMLSSQLTPPDSSISVAILQLYEAVMGGAQNACRGTHVRNIRRWGRCGPCGHYRARPFGEGADA